LLLEAKNLAICYGAVKVLENVSFKIMEGEIVAMIGPNGAGKSTVLKAVSGILGATGGIIENGEIFFEGKSIKGLRTDELVKKGLSLVPEGRHVFPTMTVWENLEMGAFTVFSGWFNRLKKLGIEERDIKSRLEKVCDLFPILKNRKNQKAGTLSSGEQQMLTIGRALMLRPKLLLLDEPSLGLSPNYIEIVFEKLVDINNSGTSIMLVEQNSQMALEVCHRGYVFEIGSIALEGEKKYLIKNEMIKKVFLGIN